MTIKQEELQYLIPNDEQGHDGSKADLILTYDDAAQNPDGSYTVTNVTGTYQTLNSDQNVIHTDTVGYIAPGDYAGNDNELFITTDPATPYVDPNGISFTVSTPDDGNDGAGHVNFYSSGSLYGESNYNNDGASYVTEQPYTSCYRRGTRILTPRGEVAIEDLRIGDRIVTASGAARAIRWIGHRFYALSPENEKHRAIRIAAGALADHVPARDLFVSPRHAMLLDGVLIEARWLLNGVSITQPAMTAAVEYFHLELDRHDSLVAERAPSESLMGANRHRGFDNAAEFAALYPRANPAANLRSFAPRVQDGFALEDARRRIAARAGLRVEVRDLGPLEGGIDTIADGIVTGRARNIRQPDVPVCLDILVDGRQATQVLARNGAFSLRLDDVPRHAAIQLRRSIDRAFPAPRA